VSVQLLLRRRIYKQANSCHALVVKVACNLLVVKRRDIGLTRCQTMIRLFVLAVALFGGIASANAQTKPIAVKYRLQIVESGSFFLKTIKEMGTPEAATAISTACAAFQVDCSEQAFILTTLISMTLDDSVVGEEHHGIIRAPVGYEICKVKIDSDHASVDSQSSFSGEIIRDPRNNGLGYYAEVPRYRPEGHSVEADLYLEFVSAGMTATNGCFPTSDHTEQAHLWDWHNGGDGHVKPEAHYP
jgi:hypothetical protein